MKKTILCMKAHCLLKEQTGSVLVLTMGFALGVILIAYSMMVFSMASAVIRDVRNAGQLTLDRYTIQAGREAMQSIKNGHDYTPELRPGVFLADYRRALGIGADDTGYYPDSGGRIRFQLRDMDIHFYQDKQNQIKTQASYTMVLPLYLGGLRIAEIRVPVSLGSQYVLKQ